MIVDPYWRFLSGTALLQAGEAAEAADEFARGLALEPENPTLRHVSVRPAPASNSHCRRPRYWNKQQQMSAPVRASSWVQSDVMTTTTVAHIITALGSGGAERVLCLVASHATSGMRHVVISLSDTGVYGDDLRKAGVQVECLGMRRGRLSPAAFVRLVWLLRRLRPDIVMTWLYHADLMGTLAGRLAGIRRIIWNIRCSDMDFSRYAPMTRKIATLLARLSWLPWAVATNSHAGRRVHEALGYRPRRWAFLPNGFDIEQWKPDAADRAGVRRELGLAEGDFVLGMVARVDPQKDHAGLLEAVQIAARKHPRLRLVLVGKDTRELSVPPALRHTVTALGERRDMPRLMRTFDVVVLPSAYGEGFPNVVGEAMASGVPCVVTDIGDAAFVVGGAGIVVPPRAPAAVAAAIENLIARPPEELRALAALGRERIERDFSIASCLGGYGDLFRAALSADSKAGDIVQ